MLGNRPMEVSPGDQNNPRAESLPGLNKDKLSGGCCSARAIFGGAACIVAIRTIITKSPNGGPYSTLWGSRVANRSDLLPRDDRRGSFASLWLRAGHFRSTPDVVLH